MTFIEDRPLNRIEILELLNEAPQSETKHLKAFIEKSNIDPHHFFDVCAVYKYGLIINKRPIYFAYVTKRDSGGYELWTVVNSDVKEQKSLYKYSKKHLMEALEQFSPIYATMEKHNAKNIAWVERMGFRRQLEDINIIRFVIDKKE